MSTAYLVQLTLNGRTLCAGDCRRMEWGGLLFETVLPDTERRAVCKSTAGDMFVAVFEAPWYVEKRLNSITDIVSRVFC